MEDHLVNDQETKIKKYSSFHWHMANLHLTLALKKEINVKYLKFGYFDKVSLTILNGSEF